MLLKSAFLWLLLAKLVSSQKSDFQPSAYKHTIAKCNALNRRDQETKVIDIGMLIGKMVQARRLIALSFHISLCRSISARKVNPTPGAWLAKPLEQLVESDSRISGLPSVGTRSERFRPISTSWRRSVFWYTWRSCRRSRLCLATYWCDSCYMYWVAYLSIRLYDSNGAEW